MLSINMANTGDYSKFKSARNRFVAQLRRSKKHYFIKMNPRDTKKILENRQSLKKSSHSIPTLSHNGVSASDDIEKANMLNSFFPTCFNTSHSALSEENQDIIFSPEYLAELFCTTDEVEHLRNLVYPKPLVHTTCLERCSNIQRQALLHQSPNSSTCQLSLDKFPLDGKDLW